jgi:NAD(P)H-flavin reductase
MMRFVVYEALARRIAPERIFLSLERNMKCGQGFCGHCQLGPLFICKQGPVFDYQTLEPYLQVEDF